MCALKGPHLNKPGNKSIIIALPIHYGDEELENNVSIKFNKPKDELEIEVI